MDPEKKNCSTEIEFSLIKHGKKSPDKAVGTVKKPSVARAECTALR